VASTPLAQADPALTPESLPVWHEALNTAEAGAREALGVLLGAARSRAGVEVRVEHGWWETLSDLLISNPATTGGALRIELLLTCCQSFLKEGRFSLGQAAARRAIAIAEEAREDLLLRRAYTVLGALYSRGERIDQAVVNYVKAIEIAERCGDTVGLCSTVSNLAGALYRVGLYDDSTLLSNYAADLAGDVPELQRLKVHAFQHMALVALRKRDYRAALENIRYAVSYSTPPSTKEEAYARVILEHSFITILASSGDVSGAAARLAMARSFAALANSRLADLQLSTAQCVVDTHAGRVDISLSRLDELLSRPQTNQALLDDQLEAAMIAHQRAGDHAIARRYQSELLSRQCELRRNAALQQIMAVKAICQPGRKIEGWVVAMLPEDIAARLGDEGPAYWAGFREQLETIAVVAELRDDPTGAHAFRVGRLAGLLAEELGMDREAAERLELAARLRDIGKLVIPDSILLSREPLSEEELAIMRLHTVEGARVLLSASNAPHIQLAAEIATSHHEWWDGSGYPNRQVGNAIPLSGQIVALADTFDALTHVRPHKGAWSVEQSLRDIEARRASQFNPHYCDAFVILVRRLHAEHADQLDDYLARDARKLPLHTANKVVNRLTRFVRMRESTKHLAS
jgi:putative two-component system response regulator